MNGSLNGRRRVVVTGMGAVTPLGNDVESTWDNLVAGKSGAADIEQWDASEYPVNFAWSHPQVTFNGHQDGIRGMACGNCAYIAQS